MSRYDDMSEKARFYLENWDEIDMAEMLASSNEVIEQLKTELAALHEGEEELADEYVEPTPAQWLWRWNRATPEQRLDMTGRVLQAFGEASRCFMEAHASQAQDGRTAMAALRRVRALAAEWQKTGMHLGAVVTFDEAASVLLTALEPPKETP